MRGRPRTPTHLHVVSGSAKKHPDRMKQRLNEPECGGGDLIFARPPAHIKGDLRKLWLDLLKYLHPRVTTAQDALAFEVLVRLTEKLRGGDASAADIARLQAMLGEFGMTPAARSRVAQAKKPEEAKGFAALKGAG